MRRRAGLALWVMLLISALAACSSRLPLPVQAPALQSVQLPLQLHLRYQRTDLERDAIVVIQREATGLRFSMFDAMGVPLARQILRDGRWYADGLLAPNSQARQWFAGLLFALTDAEHLQQQYPSARWSPQQRTLANGWLVLAPSPRHWQVIFNSEQRLQVEQMEWQP